MPNDSKVKKATNGDDSKFVVLFDSKTLNGKTMVDYEGIAIKDKGPIGLQLHGGRHMKVAFRNIQVRER